MLKVPQLFTFWLALAAVAFGLNLTWEYAQCQEFFVHGTQPKSWASLIGVTVGDVALTAAAYFAVAGLTRSWQWPLERWTSIVWATQILLALMFSIAIEMEALKTGRWSYTATAPRIPTTAISLIPVLQLIVLFPACFGLGRFVTSRIGLNPSRMRGVHASQSVGHESQS